MLLNKFLVKTLEKSGCEAVFHVPGGAAFHLVDAISKSKKLKLVPCFHEQACAIAAEAYYKTSGKVGVVLVTAGPGLSNISTGVLSAYVDRIPMIILSGQAQSKYLKHSSLRIFGPQAVSAEKLFGNISKVLEINSQTKVNQINKFIKFQDYADFGPKIIQVPLDLQRMHINNSSKNIYNFVSIKKRTKDKDKLFKTLEKLIKESKRPSVLIGGGLRNDEGKEILKDFSKNNDIPIALTWTSKDMLSNNNKNYCGLPGYFCNRAANASLYYSDLIIVIGSRLDPLQLGYQTKELLKDKKFVIIDNDRYELKKHDFQNMNKFVYDGVEALKILNKILIRNNFKFSEWAKLMHKSFIQSQDEMVSNNSEKLVDPFNFVSEISSFKTNIFIAGSSGGSAEISFLNYKISNNQIFLNSPGLGSMGFAVPSIIGALESKKNASIITVVGDGGFQFNIQELASISRYKNRKVLIVVLNNRGYDSMRRSLKKYFGNAYFVDEDSGLKFPNLKKLSASYDLKYYSTNSNKKFKVETENIWKNLKQPAILEVFTRENIESFPKLSPKMNKDGSISSGSLIDCSPSWDSFYNDIEKSIENFK